ncbi:unnamed protein product [Oppiella nova]|uniref:Uncharacterized protein n=1 Tax=Oppiella nova TaxID=334625 RepID=A0A7R9LHE6_9ACAR|nr:unnamed protein product [Oppiella nova]CAG2163560.1 unnamed protein product [Oppiella nova]
MSEFSELGKDDKLGLLMAGFPKIIRLLSVLNFNFEGRFWTLPFLSAVLLFNPNCSILVHRHFITLQQKTYMYLLQRYLEIKHNSKSESETRFRRLMNCVNELHVINEFRIQNRKNLVMITSTRNSDHFYYYCGDVGHFMNSTVQFNTFVAIGCTVGLNGILSSDVKIFQMLSGSISPAAIVTLSQNRINISLVEHIVVSIPHSIVWKELLNKTLDFIAGISVDYIDDCSNVHECIT